MDSILEICIHNVCYSSMQAGNDCAQAIPSSVSVVLNDDDMLPAEVCNASDSDHIRVVENVTTLTLLVTLKCSYLLGYGSEHTGNLVLKTFGGASVMPGFQFGKISSILVSTSLYFQLSLHVLYHLRYKCVDERHNNHSI